MGMSMYFILILCRFPFYYEAKLMFILWLQLPYTEGATILYKTVRCDAVLVTIALPLILDDVVHYRC